MAVVHNRIPILTLPQDVAERIAAGEVIERPASVVKELVENALDAGGHEVRVEIRGGGLRLIRVTDDGYGIPGDELERACARHTTSKISSVEDLSRLHTLGFRGEALASIAAGSEWTWLSRPIETEGLGEGAAAAVVTLRGGEVTQQGRRARLHGTTVTVRELFYNVPARLKFMRGARTETGHILQLMRRYVVGYPGVRFNLTIEEHTALQTSGSGNLVTTLAELYHLPLAEVLHPASVDIAEGYTLHGYIGNRALAQSSRQHVMLFINGRWVQSRTLQDALEAGAAPTATSQVLATLHPLAQLQQAVILAEAPDGSLYLIDQHRAHERIIYEHLRSKHVGVRVDEGEEWAGTDSHLLLEPVIVELKRYQAELLEQRLPILRDLGLECERFGGRSFLVRSVPGGAGQEQLAGHIHELAELASEDSADWEDHLLIGLACRSALRRGRDLGTDEQRALITALATVSAPAVCPHGSPILLHYSRTFLIDKFDW